MHHLTVFKIPSKASPSFQKPGGRGSIATLALHTFGVRVGGVGFIVSIRTAQLAYCGEIVSRSPGKHKEGST